MTEAKSYRKNPDVSWRTIEGQAVLVFNKEGEVQVLNEVGTYVWEHVEEDPREMAAHIAAEYDVDPDQAETDVRTFLKEIKASGALIPD